MPSTPIKPVCTNTSMSGGHQKDTPKADRFIPNRCAMDLDICNYNLVSKENVPQEHRTEYSRNLARQLFTADEDAKVLAFKQKPPAPTGGAHLNALRMLHQQNKKEGPPKVKTTRVICPTAEKILDAPDMVDDYYLNLLDWTYTDLIAVALNTKVYLWNATSGDVQQLQMENDEVPITSVNWAGDGTTLAVGTDDCTVQLWDCARQKRVRTLRGHSARVSCLAWNNHVVSSGSRDTMIYSHDVRVRDHKIASLACHTQEVCGLKYSLDGTQLASGGNDNKLCIWDVAGARGNVTPRFELLSHTAAVKALGWAPFQKNLLASGGGTQDRTIRFWNTSTGECVNSIDAGSQVCSLLWSRHSRELVTSHGFTDFQLSVWKYPSLARIADLKGHESRVLYTALSPDGKMVVSAAGDETIRFWKVFDQEAKKVSSKRDREEAVSSLRGINIR
uniref:CDC20/Fizzy WD40 domain-containing protein n=1 Tax=Eutreptiella gymnastica TaxID=73025 RepID=A0A7S1JCM1_9EUGL|mmetsp:Transcript_82232/g.145286  ORF Transcript_82232/g.145286 Transcript_82232/m.145286 type:complete len:447 (+) Transcript_82232:122-1462(+)